jgi:hypothetical protein
MNKLMKKIVAIVAIATVSVWLVGPGAAQAVTAADLQAQIDALLANLATLQAQLTAMGGGTAATACTFTRALYPGVTGADVQCLQQYLNGSGHPVAASGAGSPGNETTYYGSRTTAAVSAWQAANSVACGAYCGYFGPVSRAKYTSLCPVTPTCDSDGTCDAGETHANCAADCPAVTCGNGTCDTGETTATCPADCPATACTAEGAFTVLLSASPVSRTVNAGAGIEAYGIDIRATNSDMTIGRVDLRAIVQNAVTGTTENPGNFILAVKVYDTSVSDANLKKTVTSPVFTQDAAGLWSTQLSDLNFVVTKNTTKKLLIVIDTGTTIDQNRTTTIGTYPGTAVTGIRARDCKGIDSYLGLAVARVLTVQQPGVATVTITQGADNPNSHNIKADVTNGVQTNETLLSLNAKATAGSAALVRLEMGYATPAGGAATLPIPAIIYLYDGDTMVSSATPGATENGRATFENFVLPLEQNVTKNLKVKANWAAAAAFESGGAATQVMALASTALNAAGGVIQRANGQQVGVVITANINSNWSWISESGLSYTLVSKTATFTPKPIASGTSIASGTIVFKVVPFGGTLIEPAYGSGATSIAEVANGMLVRIEAPWASGSEAAASGVDQVISYTVSSSLGAGQNVPEDEPGATVTVKMDVARPDNTTAGAGQNIRFKVEDICSSVGLSLLCQGSSSSRFAVVVTTGNLFDSWVTDPVYFTD